VSLTTAHTRKALHATWLATGDLLLWGEDAARLREASTAVADGSTAGQAPAHPFNCSPASLRRILRERLGVLPAGGTPGREATLLLPTTPAGPAASPALAVVSSDDGPPGAPAPWRVGGLTLRGDVALSLLLQLTEREEGVHAVRVGASLAYLVEVAKLALEEVAAGRFLPGVVLSAGRARATWRPEPVAVTSDARVGALMGAMPGVLRAAPRAATVTDRLASGGRARWADVMTPAPGHVLARLLRALVDACVRRGIGGASLLPASEERSPDDDTAVECWFAALGNGGDPSVAPGELEGLDADLRRWEDPARRLGAGGLRTCFRLISPDAPDDHDLAAAPRENTRQEWWLEVLLQSAADPSVLVGAADVWQLDPQRLPMAGEESEDPHARLLEDLGHAAQLFPALERALDQSCPEGVALSLAEAYRFLHDATPAFVAHGFHVMVPPRWSRRRPSLGVQLEVRSDAEPSAELGVAGLCEYSWRAALGDETLELEELRRLARLKQPLVRLRGQWVELRAEDVEAALALVEESQGGGTMTAARALRLGLGLEEPEGGVPVVGVEATGWLGGLLDDALDGRIEPLPTPGGLRGELRPYQERGLGWLVFLARLGLGGCLADDMGLGKTVQLLALMVAERQPPDETEAQNPPPRATGPTLLVCPMSVVGNWQRETERFAPELRVHVQHGPGRPAGEELARISAASDLVISTYQTVARDAAELARISWGRVALDEAQHIKNSGTRQARAVRTLQASQRVALTGTPVENRLIELWSIMEFLNPGLLGAEKRFERNFAVPIERFRDEEKAATLQRLVRPFVLRRLKTDATVIQDLPEKLEIKTYCNLTREQATLYQAVVDDMLARLKGAHGIGRRGVVLATLTRLKQVCNHPAHMLADGSALAGRSGKLARVEELLDEVVALGERALVFTQYTAFGHLLQPHLSERLDCEVPFLHGGTRKGARDAMVESFQAGRGAPVLLLSLKAGGTGLNLTAANHVVHVDRWWNPAVEDQATDRAYRIGQRRDVQVRKLICVGTVEERIDQMIERKRDLAERIVGSGEAWLTELSTAELRDLVRLSADAVRDEEDDA
jgi:non-specific serine/threonine protein kinase